MRTALLGRNNARALNRHVDMGNIICKICNIKLSTHRQEANAPEHLLIPVFFIRNVPGLFVLTHYANKHALSSII